MEKMTMISTPTIGADSRGTRAFTMARLRAAAGVIGGAGIGIDATPIGAPAPGSVPDLH